MAASVRTTYVATQFRLGTLGCPGCGALFPLHTDGATQACACHACGLMVYPNPALHDTTPRFDAAQLRATEALTTAALQSGTETEDTRATEEAMCEKCKRQRKCYVFAQQTRGADEGQTIFYECSVCTHQWSLNS